MLNSAIIRVALANHPAVTLHSIDKSNGGSRSDREAVGKFGLGKGPEGGEMGKSHVLHRTHPRTLPALSPGSNERLERKLQWKPKLSIGIE